ncbi:MAG: phosphatase PAP2 family protein [Opitutales bacterium]
MVDSRIPHVEPRALLLPAGLLAATVVFFGLPGLGGEAADLWFQSLFWDGRAWLVPHDHPAGLLFAYRGPKGLVILLALGLIGAALFRPRIRVRALFLLACLALVTVVSTQLRAVTHMATPLELKLYGGAHEHLLLFQAKPAGYPCHAFPAGHASGGFALIAFYWIQTERRWRGLALGLGMGAWMGLYQVARGEHFLSHTVATALLAWLLCALLAWAMRGPLGREVSSPS